MSELVDQQSGPAHAEHEWPLDQSRSTDGRQRKYRCNRGIPAVFDTIPHTRGSTLYRTNRPGHDCTAERPSSRSRRIRRPHDAALGPVHHVHVSSRR
jgi:hypothetical protein